MGGLSIWHWLIVLVVVLLLLGGGKGKVSALMGDFGKGIKSFKESLGEDDKKKAADASMADNGALNAPVPPVSDPAKPTINQG